MKKQRETADKDKIKYYEKMIKSAGERIFLQHLQFILFLLLSVEISNKVIIDELVKNKANFKFVGEDGMSSIGKFVQWCQHS